MTRFGTRLTAGPVTLSGIISGGTGLEVVLIDAATIAIDARLSEFCPRKVFFCQLTDAVGAMRIIGNPTAAVNRQPFILILKQSASGGNGWTLGTKYRTGEYAIVPSTAPNVQDYVGFQYDGYADKFDVTSFMRAY